MSESRNLPGFTAGSAVYAARRSYRIGARSSSSSDSSGVVPSIGRAGRGRDCIPGCICVTPEGCPCCDTIFPVPETRGEATRNVLRERATPTVATCEPGAESICVEWCDHAGGGLSSNPDGSVSCTVY